jgi:phosphatidate cytidylyltransferase
MKRVVTAALLALFAVYLIFWAPYWVFALGVAAVGALCYWEYSGLVKGHSIQRPGVFGFLAGLLVLFAPQHLVLLGFGLLAVLALTTALRYEDLRDVLPQVACAILGGLYCFTPWRFAIGLRRANAHWLFFALAICWAGDTAAFYVGRAFGRHKLAPVVSPGKSWEGAVGSAFGSVIFGILYLHYFDPSIPGWQVALIALAGNIASQFGDLAESAMKRGAGVKDSGNLLPGHGGLLDRVDANLFAIPVVYLCFGLIDHWLLG